MTTASCPHCRSPLARHRPGMDRCVGCGSVMVTEARLSELLVEVGAGRAVSTATRDAEWSLACPHCHRPMAAREWRARPVEQCDAHGLFITSRDLAAALQGDLEEANARTARQEQRDWRDRLASVLNALDDLI